MAVNLKGVKIIIGDISFQLNWIDENTKNDQKCWISNWVQNMIEILSMLEQVYYTFGLIG